uniref:Uncharacterized protein LOC113784432 n=1 Tax=Cicer arietinum TaxID=3827 RepID=A0A3Q7Y6U4_CICAR|nr:uncharacterized protein LOC113784432 [Cicer arietinum]
MKKLVESVLNKVIEEFEHRIASPDEQCPKVMDLQQSLLCQDSCVIKKEECIHKNHDAESEESHKQLLKQQILFDERQKDIRQSLMRKRLGLVLGVGSFFAMLLTKFNLIMYPREDAAMKIQKHVRRHASWKAYIKHHTSMLTLRTALRAISTCKEFNFSFFYEVSLQFIIINIKKLILAFVESLLNLLE